MDASGHHRELVMVRGQPAGVALLPPPCVLRITLPPTGSQTALPLLSISGIGLCIFIGSSVWFSHSCQELICFPNLLCQFGQLWSVSFSTLTHNHPHMHSPRWVDFSRFLSHACLHHGNKCFISLKDGTTEARLPVLTA